MRPIMYAEPSRRLLTASMLCLVLLGLAAAAAPLAAAKGDAVLDAKRKAAEQLLREGKPADAVTLLMEITAADGAGWKDFLLLARANDKLKRDRDTAAAYRKVAELIGPRPKGPEERTARNESDQRLAVLDVMHRKIDDVVKDFEKRIQELGKESEKAQDWDAVGRLMALQVGIRKAEGATGLGYFAVSANKTWQPSEIMVRKGLVYRVRAVGKWRIAPGVTCTADGIPDGTRTSRGSLACFVRNPAGVAQVSQLGTNLEWTAPETGNMWFGINDGHPNEVEGKEDNAGTMQVYVEAPHLK